MIIDFLATCLYSRLLLRSALRAERHAELREQRTTLRVVTRGGHDRHRQSVDLLDLVEVDLRKNDLFAQTDAEISATIETLVGQPAKIANSRQCHADEAVEEF